MVDINKEPIKSLCPLLSEVWNLEEAKGAVSREVWVEQKEPHGDWADSSWFRSIGQEELDTALEEEFELETEEELETWSAWREGTHILAAGFSV